MRRHRSFRLRWSRYYQFLVEGQVFYMKQKAFTNDSDGCIEWEVITEQTYREALKRGYRDNVVVVEEEISIADVQALTLIFNEICQIDEDCMRQAVIEGQESVRELRRHTRIPKGLEYRIFKRVTELKLNEFEEVAI
ncbi:hypothetical protein [Anaerosalibacter sp. Marseille-P3206]|uniref:hypothetical protein n=1 Tax=Anaerosalibacter sp. Marseille-P3206 TaxID=1871005 RepID=UPI000985B3B1|nr:hypothetical protein [Anaerosalibacter sp. Marseille-P3206]